MEDIYFFYDHNCRKFKVEDVSPYLNLPNVAINPNLSKLVEKKVKQQYWKFIDGEVIEKTDEEKAITDAYHASNIIRNPMIIEKRVEVPVDRIVEKIVTVDRPMIREVPVGVKTPYIPQWVWITHGILIGVVAWLIINK